MLLVYFCQKSEVTDIGPKDSNFPQNVWGLLDSTVQDHIFSVIPGNSDHIFSIIPGNSDHIFSVIPGNSDADAKRKKEGHLYC